MLAWPGCCAWAPGCCSATSRPRVSRRCSSQQIGDILRQAKQHGRHRAAGRAEPALRHHRRRPALPARRGPRRRVARQRRRSAPASRSCSPISASEAPTHRWRHHETCASDCDHGGRRARRRSPRSPAAAAAAPAAAATRSSATTRSCSAVLNDQSGVYAAAVRQELGQGGGDGDRRLQGQVRRQGRHHEHRGGSPPTTRTSPTSPTPRRRSCTTGRGVDAIFDVPTSSAALTVADVAKAEEEALLQHHRGHHRADRQACNKYTFHYAYDTYMLANGTGTTVTEQGAQELVHRLPGLRLRAGHEEELHRPRSTAAGGTVVGRPTPPRSRTTTSPRSCSRRRR